MDQVPSRTVTLSEMLTEPEQKALRLYVRRARQERYLRPTPHQAICSWLKWPENKAARDRIEAIPMRPEFAAYAIEYAMELSDY